MGKKERTKFSGTSTAFRHSVISFEGAPKFPAIRSISPKYPSRSEFLTRYFPFLDGSRSRTEGTCLFLGPQLKIVSKYVFKRPDIFGQLEPGRRNSDRSTTRLSFRILLDTMEVGRKKTLKSIVRRPATTIHRFPMLKNVFRERYTFPNFPHGFRDEKYFFTAERETRFTLLAGWEIFWQVTVFLFESMRIFRGSEDTRVSLENFQGSRVGYLRCKDLFTRLIFSSESRELTREISRNEDVTRRPIDYSSFIPNAWQLLNEHFRGYVNICAEFCVATCVPGKYSDVQSFKFAIRESVYTRMQVKSYSGG